MKRLAAFAILSFGLILLSAQTVRSQGAAGVGLHGGVTFANMTGDFFQIKGESRTGVMFGAYGQYRFHRNASFELDVNYVQKGTENAQTIGGEIVGYRLSYVEVPLLLNLIIPAEEQWWVRFYGGGAVAFNTTCEVQAGVSAARTCTETSQGGLAKDVEVSFPLAVGISYQTGVGRLGLDLRYSIGLTDALENADAKTQTYELLLRWTYWFGEVSF